MKTLLALSMLLFAACGSSETQKPVEATYGQGWTQYQLDGLYDDCRIASDGLFPEVTDYEKFCECWSGYIADRIGPEPYQENTFAVLQLLGNKPRQECAK